MLLKNSAIAVLALLSGQAYGAANLAMACRDVTASTRNSSTSPCVLRTFEAAAGDEYVMSDTGTAADPWGTATAIYRKFSTLAATDRIHVCKQDIATGTSGNSCVGNKAWVTKAALTPASPLPVPPTGGIQNGTGRFKLSWSAPVDNGAVLVGYKVYSATTGSPLGLLATVANPATLEYAVTGVQNGSYDYAVTAYTSDQESVRSPTIRVTVNIVAPPPLIPNAPRSLSLIEILVTSP